MKNLVSTLVILFISFCITKNAIGQGIEWGYNDLVDKVASLKIKVDYIDSFYVLNAQVKVIGKEKIIVQKNLRFRDNFCRSCMYSDDDYKGTILLSKFVMIRTMIWAPDEYNTLYQPVFDASGKIQREKIELQELKPKDSINFSAKLNNMYPLEIGAYVIYARVRVKYKGKWFYIYTEPISFEVDKLPPTNAAFHYLK
jgi:hypothetical protein